MNWHLAGPQSLLASSIIPLPSFIPSIPHLPLPLPRLLPLASGRSAIGAREIFAHAVFRLFRCSLTPPLHIHHLALDTSMYYHNFPFRTYKTAHGAPVRRADDASGGCTWHQRITSAHHASRPSAGRPRAGRAAVVLPHKGIAQSEQLSSRGGSRSLPASKALRPDCNR